MSQKIALSELPAGMLGRADMIGFVSATDMDRAKTFYQGGVGLVQKADDGFALVFDCHGTMLRVSNVHRATVAPYTILGRSVPAIKARIRDLQMKGVAFERFGGFHQDGLGVWTAPGGTKVAWFKDPEANVLSLTEFHD